TVSIALIICTFFVQKQLSYTRSIDVGITRDHVLQIHNMHLMGSGADVLKERLKNDAIFTAVSRSGIIPPHVWTSDRYRAEDPDQPVVDLHYMRCDEDLLPLLQVKFVLGRNFDRRNSADKYHVIINEEAVKVLGMEAQVTWDYNPPTRKYFVQSYNT